MSKQKKIRQAIFPVAGMGTRFLPATKANPKEMMPIVDKPLIQYAVEEAIAAGIEQLIFITSGNKRAIEDHFDNNFELETKLLEKGNNELLATIKGILPKGISCVYIRQSEALGLGHAVLCAKSLINEEAFAVLLADDLIDSSNNTLCLQQMVEHSIDKTMNIVAVQKIDLEDSVNYGMVGFDKFVNGLGKVQQIIEKPIPNKAPSNLAVVGRYIFTPTIFSKLEQIKPGKNGEIQLTDAIDLLLKTEPVFAYEFSGKRYDCGNKLGYLQAIVEYGLKHPEISEKFNCYIQSLQTTLPVVDP